MYGCGSTKFILINERKSSSSAIDRGDAENIHSLTISYILDFLFFGRKMTANISKMKLFLENYNSFWHHLEFQLLQPKWSLCSGRYKFGLDFGKVGILAKGCEQWWVGGQGNAEELIIWQTELTPLHSHFWQPDAQPNPRDHRMVTLSQELREICFGSPMKDFVNVINIFMLVN